MLITGIARTHFLKWVFTKNIKRCLHLSIGSLRILLIEEWLNRQGYHFIPSPILGSKNGYDSFPLIGWRTDLIMTNKETVNSYYMGYPIGEWFVADSLEQGETLDDLNIDKFETIQESKLRSMEEALKIYNIRNK